MYRHKWLRYVQKYHLFQYYPNKEGLRLYLPVIHFKCWVISCKSILEYTRENCRYLDYIEHYRVSCCWRRESGTQTHASSCLPLTGNTESDYADREGAVWSLLGLSTGDVWRHQSAEIAHTSCFLHLHLRLWLPTINNITFFLINCLS